MYVPYYEGGIVLMLDFSVRAIYNCNVDPFNFSLEYGMFCYLLHSGGIFSLICRG